MNRNLVDKKWQLECLIQDKVEQWAKQNIVAVMTLESFWGSPKRDIKDKVQLSAVTILPLLQQLKNDDAIMDGIIRIAQETVREIKLELKDIDKQEQVIETLAMAINTGDIKINPKFVGDDEAASVEAGEKEFSLLDFSFKLKADAAEMLPEADELDKYITNSFKTLSEDEYVAAGKGLADAYPKHLRELLLEPTDNYLENMLRDNFNALQNGGEIRTPINMLADALPRETRVLAMGQVLSKLSFERGFQSVADVLNNLDDDMVEDLVRGSVDFAEAMLESAAKTGSLFKIQNGAVVHDFAKAIGRFTQVVEDAVMDADLTPDEDFLSTYREKIAEANTRQSVQRHLKP